MAVSTGLLSLNLSRRRSRRVFGLVAGSLLALGWWSLLSRFQADAIAQIYQDADGYREALDLYPSDPTTLHNLALVHMYDPVELNLAEAQSLLEIAIRLSPYDSRLWLDYARTLERQGLTDRAKQSCQTAIALAPSHFQPQWIYANTLLRAGEMPAAYAMFAGLVERNRDSVANIFELVWRSSGQNPQAIVAFGKQLHGGEEKAGLISYLAGLSQFDAAISMWDGIEDSSVIFLSSGAKLLDKLLRDRDWFRASEVYRRWSSHADDQRLVWNGDLERDITSEGLDWRLLSASGVRVRQDARVAHSGIRSLLLDFTGETRGHYAGITHYLPVEPNTRYSLSFYYKTSELTPLNGIEARIQDAGEPTRWWASDPIKASESWIRKEIQVKTGPRTRWLLLSIERMPSGGLFDYVAGQVWFDDFNLARGVPSE